MFQTFLYIIDSWFLSPKLAMYSRVFIDIDLHFKGPITVCKISVSVIDVQFCNHRINIQILLIEMEHPVSYQTDIGLLDSTYREYCVWPFGF